MAEDYVPYIPSRTVLPELTIKAVGLGLLLAMVMGAANAYLGLFVGITVSASIPAAVISMATFRGLKKAGMIPGVSILENNVAQAVASAGEALAAAMIYTLPALLLLGIWDSIDYVTGVSVALLGGVLGVLFSVSLRRILVVQERLPFPEGVACAEVLKAGERGSSSVTYIILAFSIGTLFKLSTAIETKFGVASLGLWSGQWGGSYSSGTTRYMIGGELSPALTGVGYIVGPRISSFIFSGGFFGGLIALPLISTLLPPDPLFDAAMRVRFIGVGTMLVGGLWTLYKMRSAIRIGVVEGIGSLRQSGADARAAYDKLPRTERDIPSRYAFGLALVLSLPLLALYGLVTGLWALALVAVLIALIAAYIFGAISGYITGIVGSSNNPLSGMTILVLLLTATVLVALGAGAGDSEQGIILVILVAATAAGAISIAGDNLHDLKAGHVLGSTPWKLQLALIVGVVGTAVVIPPVINLLHQVYGIGTGLAAPQAFLMAALSTGVFTGRLDVGMILVGATIGVGLVLLEVVGKVKISIMAVAVGIYLPIFLSTPIIIGGMTRLVMQHRMDARLRPRSDLQQEQGKEQTQRRIDALNEEVHTKGVLFASGLIAGEALMGVLIAALVLSGNSLALIEGAAAWPGFVVMLYIALLMAYVGWREYDEPTFRETHGDLLAD